MNRGIEEANSLATSTSTNVGFWIMKQTIVSVKICVPVFLGYVLADRELRTVTSNFDI